MNGLRRAAVLIAASGLLAAPAWALFKVVGPDGRVTYTDRPPADAAARVTPLGREATSAVTAPTPVLPADLRDVAARFPVTLYAAPDCAPCDEARRLLQQRGVPYTERRVESNEDGAALERITGARTVPSATIGTQVLRGFALTDWESYLDAANYPRESRLPRGWQAQPVTPLVARTPLPAVVPAAPPVAAPAVPPAVQPVPAPAGIRF